ncbi:shikimate 5-dehydrogenase [Sphingomonas sp. Leaf257]|jgi:shikimate dehydrogenase|uniref:shikimate 5-dehydrogenase n=1 Tax=Sphingomonas sp. Leaf257 TaxID=1736309 RepID=UPI0006FC5195|nr:shikimate 5-dehydrogenase [Sphingomonas sp. Leaf257]KQO57716.1 shikimate dehydrogenase [Sphingomonas sp. Leaf257]
MTTKPPIGRDTRLCMSLSARPGNFGSRFHNRLYELTGLDYVYKSFSTTDLAGAVGGIRALNIRGCAISMPFKEAVIPMLDGLAGSAAAIDSVNTIVNDDGRLTGYNTDYAAVAELIADIDPATPFVLRGSGGMAKAVAAALRDAGFANGTIVARNEPLGRELAGLYGFGWSSELDEGALLLINVTPIGMTGGNEDQLAFPEAMIAQAEIAFDVVQYPPETRFLSTARELGKRVITGTQVATIQALEQFVLYTGVRPTPDQVQEAADYAYRMG